MDLGQEFFRWEIATATAGAILAINPFDQPDVESAKIAARGLMKAYEETGKLAPQTPLLEADGLALFADTQNEAALAKAARSRDVPAYLAAHLARIRPGDYFAINAFVSMDNANARELEAIRHVVRDNRRVATTLGFGPRFLHSTGQLHKGGPNSGVFLEITCDDAEDLAIPGQHYQFGILKRAQELGDFQVLAEKERRILRVHVGTDVHGGLARLREIISRIS
jgi:transaldolase/glucose-6-phosphate isomerase